MQHHICSNKNNKISTKIDPEWDTFLCSYFGKIVN